MSFSYQTTANCWETERWSRPYIKHYKTMTTLRIFYFQFLKLTIICAISFSVWFLKGWYTIPEDPILGNLKNRNFKGVFQTVPNQSILIAPVTQTN